MIVAPGKTITPSVQISAQHQPLFALHQATTALQLITSAVALDDRPYQPWSRTITIPVTTKPLIGLWQLTSVVGLLTLTVGGLGMAGLVALLLFSMSMRAPAPVVPPVSQASVAPQPIIVAYIQAPVPASASQGAAPVVVPGAVNTPIVVQPGADQVARHQSEGAAAANASAPILVVDQVSAPGSAHPPSGNNQAAVVTDGIDAASRSAPMTYSTMFHEIAQRYALDWRILAAQAYVESSFDSVALGAQGDLGLMQIQPATWREWAPTVEVADPFDSYSNVLVAATYVDYLRTTLSNRGHPELEWTLVAYNWGIDKVLQHLESGQGWQELAPARQAYATEILRLAATIPAENE
jgi:soluble lytic murein transglycosylase-like protein